MSKGYKKDDIESVYKTHFGEQSLIVLEFDKETNSNYTETAIIKIHDRVLCVEEIDQWIQSVPRFRDVFIYEKIDQPLRIRLKNNSSQISFIEEPVRNEQDVLRWLECQNISFDIQKAPLFKVFVFQGESCQYLACCYHHLLFDGISIQHVFAALITKTQITSHEWLPKLETNTVINRKEITGFQLQNHVPPASADSSGFLYESLILENMSYQSFMSKWIEYVFQASGQDQICIGEVFSMRNNEYAAQNALGYFVQTWPLIFNRSDKDFLVALKNQRSEIMSISDQAVQNHFNHGLFDHCWVVEPQLKSDYETIFRSKPHYLLSIVIQPSENTTSLSFVWNLSKISAEAAKEIVHSFNEFLSQKVESTISPKRHYQLKPIIETWYEKLQLNPSKLAVKDSLGNSFSYQEIEDLSNKLASVLQLDIQEPVGIRTSNSGMLIIAMLAILKRRGIYVPLDPEISEERLNYIITDAGIHTIISDLTEIPNKNTVHPIQKCDNSNLLKAIQPELNDICYLIYTSGTTGQPKGCCVTNANLSNLFLGSLAKFTITCEDRWIMAHSYGFDFSTWEIWGALLNGCSLIIPDRMTVKDSFKFYELLLEEKITILNQTPKSFDNLMLVGESSAQLIDLKYLIFGGDKLNTKKIEVWKSQNNQVTIVNMYGITETTVHVTYKEIEVGKYSNIGNALPGYSIQIKNERNEQVPDGFIGELIVEGDGVCKGYFKKEELTQDKFNYDAIPSYKSGDLGWKMRGDFFYLGRNDRQVKIRGHRIELGEIEFLLQHKFGSLFRVSFIDQNILVAFHTNSFEIDRAECLNVLPDYANPSQFIRLDRIPLNVNGKADEQALTQLYRSTKSSIKQPEQLHADISPYLTKLLGEHISINKSFIENGGDSISAIRLVNSMRKDGFSISVQELFSSSSISNLKVQRIESKKNDHINWRSNTEIERFNLAQNTDVIGLFPLTQAQKGILYDSLVGNESVYFIQLSYHVNQMIPTEKLITAYTEVLNALPALQLQLTKWNEDYIWTLPSKPVIEINVLQESTTIHAIFDDDFKKPFDFSQNLIRLTIVEKENGDKVLIWTHHHLLMDGWSLGVFSKLLFQSLSGESPKRKDAYLNFLYHQSTIDLASNLSYWKNRLHKSTPDPLIPFFSTGEKTQEYGEYITKIEGINDWNNLSTLDLTKNQFVFAAWLTFTGMVFQKNDLSFGRVNSLREEELDEEVGMLIQTLPFTYELNLEDTFLNEALNIKKQVIEDNNHKDIPLSSLDGINLNLDAIFVFENYPIDKSLTQDSLISIGEFKEKTGAKWTLICYPEKEGLTVRILFQKDFYHPEYVAQIIGRFSEFLKNIQWNESIQEHALSFHIQPNNLGKTKELVSSTNLFKHFWKKEEISFRNNNHGLNRSDFELEIKKLTQQFIELGITAHEAIGIDVQSTKQFIKSVLSIWEIEAVPCSVDFRYPEQRKKFIWKNASCRFVLVEQHGELNIIENNEIILSKQPETASFILHTSGSTGMPKGVIQTKDCLINLADWTAKELGLTSQDRILALSSFGFDASYHELILWLELSATMVEMPFEHRQDIQEIRKVIILENITLAWIPARMLNMILEMDESYFDQCVSLKQIVTTGEALIIGDALKDWVESKNIRLFNFYGPTETHVVTSKIVDKHNISKIPDIGLPLTNASIGLFDQKGNTVPKGFIGEIWISGPYLAHGYLNDDELTHDKFVVKDNVRWYKSGDSGWIGSDGRIEYLGRLDNQIKIRGFRVEPFEVESILHSVAGIEQAAIAIDRSDDVKLIAFWTGKNMTDAEFRKACLDLMPEFMIPEIQVYLEELPRNINGKIDRQLLLNTYNNKEIEKNDQLPITNAFKCWEAVLGHSNFNLNSHFQTVGGSSLRIMRMQAWLEKNYHVSISVQELILNQTINELDRLISKKQSQISTEIPKELKINLLQRDILLSEKGRNSSDDSPFILSFSCSLPLEINDFDFIQALGKLFSTYPHLTYVLDCMDEMDQVKWVYRENFMDFVQKPLIQSSLLNSEPLLRIFFKDKILHVQWHHVLLDAMGISMVMHELFDLLTSHKQVSIRNYSLFLNHYSVENIAKTQSASASPKVFTRTINSAEKKELERIAENNEKSLHDLFLLLAHSIFEKSESIGFTDNSQQIGTPGMYTFINTSLLSNESEFLKGLRSEKPVAMVTNFMHSPELPDVRIEFKNADIKSCKYPYELQIEVSNEMIILQFITEETNPLAENKSSKLFENLEILLIEKSISSIFIDPSNASNIHFDDFDF
jgi:tyrocidine synthetase-3